MNKIYLLIVSMALMCLLGTTKAVAFDGNSVSSAVSSTTGNWTDDKTFVLYNVGTGKFMHNGGIWGTQAVLDDELVGCFNVISTNSYYYLYTQVEANGESTRRYFEFSNGTNLDYAGGFFFDGYGPNVSDHEAFCRLTFTEVSGESNVYYINVNSTSGSRTEGDYYLKAGTDVHYGDVIIGEPTTSNVFANDSAKWQLVSISDLYKEFEKTDGTNAKPVTASFLIKDPKFGRGDLAIGSWYRGHSTTESGTSTVLKNNTFFTSNTDTGTGLTSTTKPADAQKNTYSITCNYRSGNRNNSHTFTYETEETLSTGTSISDYITSSCTHSASNISSQAVSLTKAAYKYYVGNGYPNPGANMQDIESDSPSTHDYLQRSYGGTWTANIHGSVGTIFQQIQIKRAGLYKVMCKGFSTDGSGYVFANIGTTAGSASEQTYATHKLATVATRPATYVAAYDTLQALGYSTMYVLVSDASESNQVTLTIGAFTLSTAGKSDSWTCVDNFSLEYSGTGTEELILDETQTSIDYINAQVKADKSLTMYLYRTLNTAKWNSMVLPVNMTAEQVKSTFGNTTKLSVLNSTGKDKQKIIFEPADSIIAGQLYIIKPYNEITTGTKSKTINGKDITIPSYYMCAQINLTEALNSAKVMGNQVDNIQHVGTYVKVAGNEDNPAIGENTFVLGRPQGENTTKWYYNTGKIYSVKGFRGWITTGNAQSAKPQSIVINGVEELISGAPTAIDGITADVPAKAGVKGVYTLSGQKIADNATTYGLAKGLYIVNGKKVVVK